MTQNAAIEAIQAQIGRLQKACNYIVYVTYLIYILLGIGFIGFYLFAKVNTPLFKDILGVVVFFNVLAIFVHHYLTKRLDHQYTNLSCVIKKDMEKIHGVN